MKFPYSSSFTESLIKTEGPGLINSRISNFVNSQDVSKNITHGTTIIAISYDDGVLIAGDRRATMGNVIASRDMKKVFITDEYSAVGIAGTAGIATELVRLFTVELEHYEKIEGCSLSFTGKANKLSDMVRGNFANAMQGLSVVPLFIGYDLEPQRSDYGLIVENPKKGRIISFDVVGGKYEEKVGYFAVGSGAVYAKTVLKKLYKPDLTEKEAIEIALTGLMDAAEDDAATSGLDTVRQLYPIVITIDKNGSRFVEESSIGKMSQKIVKDQSITPVMKHKSVKDISK